MKKKIIILVTFLIALSQCACASKTSGKSTSDASSYRLYEDGVKPYTMDWLKKADPDYVKNHDYELEELFDSAAYILDNSDEFKEYLHTEDEYYDSNGNFKYPGKDMHDKDWKRGIDYGTYIRADAIMPQSVMDKLSTKELLEIANNEKIIASMAMRSNNLYYIEYMDALGGSRTYQEFLKRDDYPEVLCGYYLSIDPAAYIGDAFHESGSDTDSRICAIWFNEVTIVTDEVYEALNDEQRQAVLDKHEEIARYLEDNCKEEYSTTWTYRSVSPYSVFGSMLDNGVSPEWCKFSNR